MMEERESVFAKITREAESARMAVSACADDNVWNTHVAWMECGADSGGLRPTEDTVFAHFSRLSRWRFLAMRALDGEQLDAFVTDVIAQIKSESDEANEPIHHPNHKLPLREVMEKRGEGLEWVDLGADNMTGKKSVRVVVVKTGLSGRKRR